MADLKPCPFCGSEVLEMDKGDLHDDCDLWWYITCYDCPCQGVEALSKNEVIKAWNTRAEGKDDG